MIKYLVFNYQVVTKILIHMKEVLYNKQKVKEKVYNLIND